MNARAFIFISLTALLLFACNRGDENTRNVTLLANGDRVFSSPERNYSVVWTSSPPNALFVQRGDDAPKQITFGVAPAIQPTVLRDGRILFISARESHGSTPRLGLFTVNNDGTELSAFAVNDDGAPFIASPRELGDGRVAFLASSNADMSGAWTETVRLARPFLSRTRVALGEVLPNAMPRRPAGHLSAMSPGKRTGTILCLDAKFSRPGLASNAARTKRVRVLAGTKCDPLGELNVEADGSFQVEVPADTPIGFEALDSEGHVTVRLAPTFWVRPGENRSCVGCHEPYNHSPENFRPIAATKPPVTFAATRQWLTQQKP